MDAVSSGLSSFVGRQSELAAVARAIDASGDGRRGLVLIGGESGVGKTRLVTEATMMVGAGTTVLFGSALDMTEKRPFSPVTDALRRFLEEDTSAWAVEVIRPWWPSLSRLLHLAIPDGERPSGSPDGHRWPPGPGELPEVELLCQVIGALADVRPFVFVLEDLQWADPSTRDLLLYALANLVDTPLTILATYRSEAIGKAHPLRRLLVELVRNRRVLSIELAPVDREAIAALVTVMNVDASGLEDFEEIVWQRSEGNFFIAEETLHSILEGGGTEVPHTLRQIVLGRVDALADDVQRILDAVAIAGEPVSHELLAAVVRLQDIDLLAAIRSAVDASILVTDPDRGVYRFRHGLYRDVIVGELLAGERQALHLRFAEALTTLGDPADPQTITRLAHHWDEAHQWPAALRATVAAAEHALLTHGYSEANDYWRHSLQLIELVSPTESPYERTFLLERAAATASLAGEHLEAVSLMEERIRGGAEEADTEAQLYQELARFLENAGNNRAALAAHQSAVSLLDSETGGRDDTGDLILRPTPRAQVLNGLAHGLLITGQYGPARVEAERAATLAEEAGDGTELARALATLGFSLAYLEDPQAGVAALEKSLCTAEEQGRPADIARVLVDLSALYAGPLNQLEEALAMAREGAERVATLGLERTFGAELRAVAANTLFRLGRWAEGDAELSLALAARPTGVQAIELRLARAKLLIGRGDTDEAENELEALETLLAESVGPRDRVPLLTLRAGVALWQGRIGAACQSVLAGLDIVPPDSDDLWLVAPLVWHGLRALGDQAEGMSPVSRQEGPEFLVVISQAQTVFLERMHSLAAQAAQAPEAIARWVRAYLELSQGELSRSRRDPDPDPWLRAAYAWEELGHPYPTAYAWFRYADAAFALRSGSADGSTALRRAHEIACSLDAEPLLALIAALALRARVALEPGSAQVTDANRIEETRQLVTPQVPRPATAGRGLLTSALGGLTDRELVVLSEIAQGHSNREIADRLFISQKTVSAHVSHILGKLGVRSRVQASAVFYQTMGLPGQGT